jgi:hypothetical protein
MGERINRKADEQIYQPKIHHTLIHAIHEIREKTGLPMTVIVDRAIREYLEKYSGDENTNNPNQ